MSVIKAEQCKPNNIISLDLAVFLHNEILEHVEKIYDICTCEQPDSEAAEYHHEKFLNLMKMLRENQIGGT